MSAAVQTVDWINAGLYTVLAIGAFIQWRKTGGRPALWVALAFGTIGIVVVVGRLPGADDTEWVVKSELALLVLFPYLLYKFTTAFERAPRGLERFVGVMTGVLLVSSFALPDVPQKEDDWSTGFVVYVVAFLFHWSVLSIIAAVRLWPAGRGQPSVAQRRMRFLAAAAALLTAAVLLAGLGSEDSALAVVGILATLSGLGFILGVAPPAILRLLWCRPEGARMQDAVAGLMRAETPDDVTRGVLPPMLSLVGARGVALRDSSGQIVGSYRPHSPRDDEEVEVQELKLPEGSPRCGRASMPFFGKEELATLRTLGC